MLGTVKRADIDQARQQIELRRADILRRHAEEIGRLDADRAELETLHRLAGVFAQKYQKASAAPDELIPAKIASEPPIQPPIHRHTREPSRPDQRDYGRTNFETFARALAKSAY